MNDLINIKYSAMKNKREGKLKELGPLLFHLEEQRDISIESPEDLTLIQNTGKEINKIHQEETKGTPIRCKVRWYKEGKKSTHFFLNMEKLNYYNKVIWGEFFSQENTPEGCTEIHKSSFFSI